MAENLFTTTTDQAMRANIRASWDRADAGCRDQGRDWYPATNRLVTALAEVADVDPSVVAAIMAVLSPRSAWGTNVMNTAATLVEAGHLSADQAIKILAAHGYNPRDGVWRMDGPRGLGRSVAKAMAIAESENPAAHVTGQKVLSFYGNIAAPVTSTAVTIDAWAAGVALGRRVTTAEMSGLTAKQYARVADAYRTVAAELDMPAHELQATCWCEIRGRSR